MTKFLCGECIHNSDKGGGCLIPKNLGYVDNCNRYLPKDRPIEQTNEEWLCSLSMEEKAHFLSVECARAMCEQQLKITNRNGVDYWKTWLKQPHSFE